MSCRPFCAVRLQEKNRTIALDNRKKMTAVGEWQIRKIYGFARRQAHAGRQYLNR
jgi:hypothetical protein